MSAHTPGPWTYFYKSKYDEWHVSVPLEGQTMRLGLFPDGCPSERPEADARLIAAAPDMLAALEQVWKDGVIPDGFALLQDQVCDAIAKATGEGKP